MMGRSFLAALSRWEGELELRNELQALARLVTRYAAIEISNREKGARAADEMSDLAVEIASLSNAIAEFARSIGMASDDYRRLAEDVWREREIAAPPCNTIRALDATSARLTRAPGYHLDAFGKRWFSTKSYVRMLAPVIADMHEDYFAALSEKDETKAKIVHIRGCFCFVGNVVLCILEVPLRAITKLWSLTKE